MEGLSGLLESGCLREAPCRAMQQMKKSPFRRDQREQRRRSEIASLLEKPLPIGAFVTTNILPARASGDKHGAASGKRRQNSPGLARCSDACKLLRQTRGCYRRDVVRVCHTRLPRDEVSDAVIGQAGSPHYTTIRARHRRPKGRPRLGIRSFGPIPTTALLGRLLENANIRIGFSGID